MPNPTFSTRTTANQVAPSNPLNESGKKYRSKHNTFNYSRQLFNTLRYADVTPHECIEGVEGDKITISSKHNIRTHTLSSVLLSDIFMKKSYFSVDMKAILPNNWDKIYKNPSQGDDIPSDNVNTVVYNLISSLQSIYVHYQDFLVNNSGSAGGTHDVSLVDNVPFFLSYHFRLLLMFESFFSNGSLLSSFGCHLSPYFSGYFDGVVDSADSGHRKCFDDFFDKNIDILLNTVSSSDTGISITYKPNDNFTVTKYFYEDPTVRLANINLDDLISLRQLVDLFREHPDAMLNFVASNVNTTIDLAYTFNDSSKDLWDCFRVTTVDNFPINYSRLCAYQLVCSQFYTNDKVDNIFTAHDYLDNMQTIYDNILSEHGGDYSSKVFWYNGTSYQYDVLSGKVLEYVLDSFVCPDDSSNLTWFDDVNFQFYSPYFGYLSNLFSYRRSLRYGDYFTGSRTQPYAVGDITVPVTDSSVSAIDTTRSILRQRFFNLVERIGSRWEDYIRDVTDGVPAPDVTIPRFLASETSSVRGFEVENTAENQGNIVTILNSSDSNYVYEISVGQPCIILGLTHFEIPRIYSRTVDRFFFHTDRFSMFNKFMQYTGDQEIYQAERYSAASAYMPFGYTLRHMEYKQRFPIASGGFINNLPSWLFITDNNEGYVSNGSENYELCPDYVHSHNHEFDRFFESLTGYSLGSYFHFIVKYDNIIKASRQMDYAPTIL